jgi:hypothetical protein
MAQELPVPPSFTPEADAEEVLQQYPLGVITAVAAHSHHGHADHKIDSPNGLLGWVYEVSGGREVITYVLPSGGERTVREIDPESPRWAYTLVFGGDGTVIDVLQTRSGGERVRAGRVGREKRGTARLAPLSEPG